MKDSDLWSWVYTTSDPNLRAADQDRETVAARLRGHHADGRLDTDELSERIDRCYQAKTVGELERLLVDLPRSEAPERGPGRRTQLWRLGAVVVPIWIALGAVSAITGTHLLWLVIPFAFLARRLPRTRPLTSGASVRGSADERSQWPGETRPDS